MAKKTHLALIQATTLFTVILSLGTPAAVADDEWEFMVAPLFLWGMSIDGESAIEGNALPLDLSFSDDLLENMDAVATLHFEARKGNLLLFAEYQYVSLDPEFEAAIGPVSINASLDFVVHMAEAGGGYTVSRTDSTRWEVLGGLRWSDHDIDVDLDGPPPLPSKIQGGGDWYHGFIGGRVMTELGKNWQLIARADYGYGGSDNSALHFTAMVDYRFNDWGSAFFGYRYLEMDYESRDYLYDAKQQGPQLGIAIYW